MFKIHNLLLLLPPFIDSDSDYSSAFVFRKLPRVQQLKKKKLQIKRFPLYVHLSIELGQGLIHMPTYKTDPYITAQMPVIIIMNDSMWMVWLARHTWIFQNKKQSLASPRAENKEFYLCWRNEL